MPPTTDHPRTHEALRYLRQRAGLTRKQVAEIASQQAQSISAVFIAQCEANPATVKTTRRPSPQRLTQLLAVLGSDELEWEQLLAAQPWRQRTRRVVTPASASAVGEGGEWEGTDRDGDVTAAIARLHQAYRLAGPDERRQLDQLADKIISRKRS